jgi:hypothetical protein
VAEFFPKINVLREGPGRLDVFAVGQIIRISDCGGDGDVEARKCMAEIRPRSDLRVFFWMPKAGGGTLTAGIRGNRRVKWPSIASADALPAPSSAQIWFGGHTAFGLHLIYGAEPVYFTVLRDPIERLIAEFFYHHQHKLPGIFIPDNEIVPAFVRMVESAGHLNYYSYMFSDYCFAKEAAVTNLAAWDGEVATARDLIVRREKRHGFLAENIPFHEINIDEAFRRASRNILLMRFVGFFDQLNNVTANLYYEFGLKVGLSMRMHKTTWKPGLKDLPGDVAAMLARKTEADYEFFHSVRQASATAVHRSWWLRGRKSQKSA